MARPTPVSAGLTPACGACGSFLPAEPERPRRGGGGALSPADGGERATGSLWANYPNTESLHPLTAVTGRLCPALRTAAGAGDKGGADAAFSTVRQRERPADKARQRGGRAPLQSRRGWREGPTTAPPAGPERAGWGQTAEPLAMALCPCTALGCEVHPSSCVRPNPQERTDETTQVLTATSTHPVWPQGQAECGDSSPRLGGQGLPWTPQRSPASRGLDKACGVGWSGGRAGCPRGLQPAGAGR